jgi:beta-glucanase (GH16 family)
VIIDPKNLSGTAYLTFGDEFNAFNYWNGLSGTWDTGYPWTAANGGTNSANGEEQWYVNANYAQTASLGTYVAQGGVMNIRAAPTPEALKSYVNGYAYTSGMITSFHSFSQTYGYFEMKAKLPSGQGLWPAFWLLPTDLSWPPEIDIMEVIGSVPNQLVTSAHYDSGGHQMDSKSTNLDGMTTGFHTYGVDWQKDKIIWYFDGAKIHEVATPGGMDKPMYMLANLAVGGEWPGSPDGTTSFPATLQIDYIRAYSALPGGTAPTASGPAYPGDKFLFTLPSSAKAKKSVIGTYDWDTLSGTTTDDKIVGREGGDVMKGGKGDDTYYVDNRSDRPVEKSKMGIDTVRTDLASYRLPANVENLVLTGKGDQRAYGNGSNNKIYSNGLGDNLLSGGAGQDQLYAGRYADTLIGGSGSDQFIFTAAPKRAGHVKDFHPGVDMLDLRALFKGASAIDFASEGRIVFQDNGSGDTLVSIKSNSGTIIKITTLDNVAPSALHANVDYLYV